MVPQQVRVRHRAVCGGGQAAGSETGLCQLAARRSSGSCSCYVREDSKLSIQIFFRVLFRYTLLLDCNILATESASIHFAKSTLADGSSKLDILVRDKEGAPSMLANHVVRKPVPCFINTVVCHGEYTRFTGRVLCLTRIACCARLTARRVPASVNLTGKLAALVLQ